MTDPFSTISDAATEHVVDRHRAESPVRFRKKPVVIEAMRMPEHPSTRESMAIYKWIEENTLGSFEPLDCIEGRKPWPESGVTIDPSDGMLVIATLEGGMKVGLGDYVIRGVNGEFYPCKPDIFAKTYEPVDDTEVGQ